MLHHSQEDIDMVLESRRWPAGWVARLIEVGELLIVELVGDKSAQEVARHGEGVGLDQLWRHYMTIFEQLLIGHNSRAVVVGNHPIVCGGNAVSRPPHGRRQAKVDNSKWGRGLAAMGASHLASTSPKLLCYQAACPLYVVMLPSYQLGAECKRNSVAPMASMVRLLTSWPPDVLARCKAPMTAKPRPHFRLSTFARLLPCGGCETASPRRQSGDSRPRLPCHFQKSCLCPLGMLTNQKLLRYGQIVATQLIKPHTFPMPGHLLRALFTDQLNDEQLTNLIKCATQPAGHLLLSSHRSAGI